MTRLGTTLGLLVLLAGFATTVYAQQAPAPATPQDSTPQKATNPLDSDTDRAFQNLIHSKDNNKGAKPQADVNEQNYADAEATASALQLSCDVDGLRIVSEGREQVDGKMIQAKAYEIACTNGMGYFIVSHSPQPPSGFSCFAAEGQREALTAKGQTFDDVCTLPGNKDVHAAAAKIIRGAGKSCAVTKLQWYGQNTANKTEYTEVACGDGKGYLVETALPGAPMQMSLIDCADAAGRGLPCRLTKIAAAAAPSPTNDPDPKPTYDMLKGALTQHGTVCTVADMRVIGKQNVSKRHVVEFQCPEYPHGLVAFIPLGTNPAKYETIDCPTAAKSGIVCKLTAPHS